MPPGGTQEMGTVNQELDVVPNEPFNSCRIHTSGSDINFSTHPHHRIHILCCATPCSAACGPLDFFVIRVSTDLENPTIHVLYNAVLRSRGTGLHTTMQKCTQPIPQSCSCSPPLRDIFFFLAN
jgi:hypothetical protein